MRRLMILIVLSLIALVGCAEATQVPLPTLVEFPTLTPEAAATEASAGIALEQNYSADLANASVSINYPTGWVLSGEFPDLGVIVATSDDLVSFFDGTLEDGQVFIEILFAPETALEGRTVTDTLEEIIDGVENPEGVIGIIETGESNGKEFAYVTLDSPTNSDGILWVIDSGDGYSSLVSAVPNEQIDTYQDVIEAIAGSISYVATASEPEATEMIEVTEEPEATEASE